MKVNIFRKHGSNLSSDDYLFTFHGLYLNAENAEKFMYEKGHLTAKSNYDEDVILYVPFEDIFEIEVEK